MMIDAMPERKQINRHAGKIAGRVRRMRSQPRQ